MSRTIEERRAYNRAYYHAHKEGPAAARAANREKNALYQRVYREANREKLTAQRRANRDKSAAYARANKAKRVAYEKANRVRIRQRAQARRGLPKPLWACPAQCECCGRSPGVRALALDHCHDTGIFRGWLCGPCNTSIGVLGDSLSGLARAAAYLRRAYE